MKINYNLKRSTPDDEETREYQDSPKNQKRRTVTLSEDSDTYSNVNTPPNSATQRTNRPTTKKKLTFSQPLIPTNSTSDSFKEGNCIIISPHGDNAASFSYSPVAISRGMKMYPYNLVICKDIRINRRRNNVCLLYTSDAADE